MAQYRKTLKWRIFLTSCLFLIIGIIFFMLNLMEVHLVDDTLFIQGFHIAAFVIAECILLIIIGRTIDCLRSEEKLKNAYIKQSDERIQEIQHKSSNIANTISLVLLSIGTVTAGFLDEAIFLTLLSATVVLGTLKLILFIYYKHRLG